VVVAMAMAMAMAMADLSTRQFEDCSHSDFQNRLPIIKSNWLYLSAI